MLGGEYEMRVGLCFLRGIFYVYTYSQFRALRKVLKEHFEFISKIFVEVLMRVHGEH